MDAEEKVEAILDWAQGNDWFDIEFVESLQARLEEGEELTEAQERALDNIMDKFGIEV